MTADLRYAMDLPDSGQIHTLLRSNIELYESRNRLIYRLRDSLQGKTPIAAPSTTQYKVEVRHQFYLAAVTNEKTSRFQSVPSVKVTPVGISQRARAKATELEHAYNGIWEQTERQSGGGVWDMQVKDALLTDGGVARVERAPAAMWPEFTLVEFKGKNVEKLFLSRPFESEEEYAIYRENYKQGLAIPLRRVYVPHENQFPTWEGPTMVESFEIERRSLRQVLSNPLYDGPGKTQLQGYANGKPFDVKQQVVLLHYTNQQYHAYYALGPVSNSTRAAWPDAMRASDAAVGTPVLLHAYKHGLGRTPYNYVSGRSGGWRGASNPQAESIMKALLDLEEDADQVASQLATNIRSQGWPTPVAFYSRENRGADDGLPAPPTLSEGQPISMWADERLENAWRPMQLDLPSYYLGQIRERIGELAGSSSLFGQSQAGVTTGYHENLAISQAEHLDNKAEDHLATGAVDATELFSLHVIAMGEPLPVYHTTSDKRGRAYGEYIALDPKDLQPMPRISAKVRTESGLDYSVNIQTFMQATADRNGNGPAVDDDWGREKLLGVTSPDEMQKRIDLQSMRRAAVGANVITQKVLERVALLQAQAGTPSVTPAMAGASDPALQQAVQTLNAPGGEAEAMGGVAPDQLAAQMEGRANTGIGQGVGGGPAMGAPQMPQVIARSQGLMQGGG